MLHNGQLVLDFSSWSLSEKISVIISEKITFKKKNIYMLTNTTYNGYLCEVILRTEQFKYRWD